MECLRRFCVLLVILVLVPAMAFAQGPGGGNGSGGGGGNEGEGGGGGCGDIFGDLIHIKRDPLTGQPILQRRLIEYPQDVQDWGYCPIALDAYGEEIGFAELSCDPIDPDAVVEVDYFGRLNGGRTKERNSRMHFDEVLSTIKMADYVTTEETGRLLFGFDCDPLSNTLQCEGWSTVDSPMENLALYARLMRYGHLQTDPREVDTWAHGDPEAGVQYHPALTEEDWAKFDPALDHLLPASIGTYGTEELQSEDFIRAAAFLGSAANKTGRITVDLVQYMNRILKITQETEMSLPNPNLLPALIRDVCDDDPGQQCIYSADDARFSQPLPAPADERFVDFAQTCYLRGDWFSHVVTVLRPQYPLADYGIWREDSRVGLMGWLNFANGAPPRDPVSDIEGFVEASSDALRAVEFIHNYAVPEDLGWNFIDPSRRLWFR